MQENEELRQRLLAPLSLPFGTTGADNRQGQAELVPGLDEAGVQSSSGRAVAGGCCAAGGDGEREEHRDEAMEGALVAQLTAALADKARLAAANDQLAREVLALQVG